MTTLLIEVEGYLERSSPEEEGVGSAAVLEFVEAVEREIEELHSFMLLRHGRVIAEGWWSPYGREHRHLLFSLSKSFTATAVGLAVSEGYFSIDDLVVSFFPDERPAEVGEFLAAMRVRHLLTMTTGHGVDSWSNMFGRPDGEWIKGFFEVPVVHAPGEHFLYNTGATYMLAAIVQKTTGMKLLDYLRPRLFEPLGIENATWKESPEGIVEGGIGLSLKTEDIARFGQLCLQKGMWQGKRVLSEAWVAAATALQVSNGEGGESDWTQGYGYQFWRCRHGAYRGDGVFGQYCVVMPEEDAVLAMTGGVDVFDMQRPLDLVWEILRPAMGSERLAEDVASWQRLWEKLSSLSLPLVQGEAGSPMVAEISGRCYVVDGNEMGIEAITLDFTESGCIVRVKRGTAEEMIACGYGRWQEGQTTLFTGGWLSGLTPVVASGAWTAGDCFTMVVRLYETPFYQTLVFHFVGDEMMVETWVNVSLESVERLLLTAHAV